MFQSLQRCLPRGDTEASKEERLEQARWLGMGGALTAICLGVALQISSGEYQGDALKGIVLALLVLLCASVVARPANVSRNDAWLVPITVLAGMFVQVGLLYSPAPERYVFTYRADLLAFNWGAGALGLTLGWALWRLPRRPASLLVGAFIAAHFALGLLLIQRSPNPPIDVYVFQRDSVHALMTGVNPYSITFPDIYAAVGSDHYYGAGLSSRGRLQFGFPYLPFSLLMSAAGQVIGHDPRYAQLVALELAAALMAFARVGGFGPIAAALFLTTPRVFYVLDMAWTEPFLVLGLAAVVFAACRQSRAVPWLFGAFIALKQYLIFAVPAVWLLDGIHRSPRVGFVSRMMIVPIGVTLPFVLWNLPAFWHSVVALQFYQPLRPDALTLLSWWTSRGHGSPSAVYSFVAAGVTAALLVWRLPRTPAGFSAAVAATFLTFFVLNKQAFCNYYFFVLGAACLMLASCHPPTSDNSRTTRVPAEAL